MRFGGTWTWSAHSEPLQILGGQLLYKGLVCVPRSGVRQLLHLTHDAKDGGNFAFAKALSLPEGFNCKLKRKGVKLCCDGCFVCQTSKAFNRKKYRTTQSLEISDCRWGSISTDFIVSLPEMPSSCGAITTYVERLLRRVHFLPGIEKDIEADVSYNFSDHIFKLHGSPDYLVSDQDQKFTSKFCKHRVQLCRVHTNIPTSHHPHTDGTPKVMNRMDENYIRFYCSLNQPACYLLLPAT